jgi:hypothetical protein
MEIHARIYYTRKAMFELTQSVCVRGYLIPAGYSTDFATVPKFLWSVLPPLGKHNRAALLHDWLYDNRIGTRAQADWLFLKQMENDGVGVVPRYAMYWGVRLFAGKWWRN